MANAEVIALARKAAGGNRKSFDELCHIKLQYILFRALTILGNHHDAEDAAQEAVIDMYRYIGNLKNPEAIDAWIGQIVRGKCIDIINKRRGNAVEPDADERFVQIADDDADFLPESYAENEELGDEIYEIVLDLPQKQREAILMYYYDDMSYKEIASITGTSINTVATNLMRARTMMKKKLQKKERVGVASATVLGRIMQKQPARRISEESMASVERNYYTAVKDLRFPAAKALAIKMVAGLSASIVVVAGIATAYLASDPMEAVATEAKSGRQIIFASNDCDCGHLNPTEAALEDLKPGDAVSGWSIKDRATKEIVYEGGGSIPPEILAKMEASGEDGTYLMTFTVTDQDGNVMDLQREFAVGVPAGSEA
jgi:RNA polymerase sigma-70 factor (ECF subfamily)